MGLLIVPAIVSIVYMIILFKYLNKNHIKMSKSFIVEVCVFIYIIAIILDITGPGNIFDIINHKGVINFNFIPFNDGIVGVFGMTLNMILFIPLGILLPSIWEKFDNGYKTVLTGFILSLVIEIFQLLNIRATDIDDLIMNTLGALIGYLIYSKLLKKFTSKNKFKNKDSHKFFIRYNSEILIIAIFMLNFFLVPVIDRIIFGI